MKILIAKILIAGSLLLGLGVIACETRDRNREEDRSNYYQDESATSDDAVESAAYDTMSTSVVDTSYDSTSDTVYKRR